MNIKMLIVEDDDALREIMSDFFSGSQFHADFAADGRTSLLQAEENSYDVILLDINLPDISGFDVCRRLRGSLGVTAPILFLTARAAEADKLNGYALGGDDYITKPFSLPVLQAKILSMLKRTGLKENIFSIGDLSLNKEAHTVTIDSRGVQLPAKEFELLLFLAENNGKLFTRQQILIRIWGYDFDGSDRVVDDHIRKIRSALGRRRSYIQTIRTAGYRFCLVPGENRI